MNHVNGTSTTNNLVQRYCPHHHGYYSEPFTPLVLGKQENGLRWVMAGCCQSCRDKMWEYQMSLNYMKGNS